MAPARPTAAAEGVQDNTLFCELLNMRGLFEDEGQGIGQKRPRDFASHGDPGKPGHTFRKGMPDRVREGPFGHDVGEEQVGALNVGLTFPKNFGLDIMDSVEAANTEVMD